MKTKRRHRARATRAQARRHGQDRPALASQPLDADGGRGVGRSDHDARAWRESCRDARAATRKQKAAIREAWRAWPGPATVACFRHIVDLHTGVLDRRRRTAPAPAQFAAPPLLAQQASATTWATARAAEIDAAVRAEAAR